MRQPNRAKNNTFFSILLIQGRSPHYSKILQHCTMILLRPSLCVRVTGHEPWIIAVEVWCAINKLPNLKKIILKCFETKTSNKGLLLAVCMKYTTMMARVFYRLYKYFLAEVAYSTVLYTVYTRQYLKVTIRSEILASFAVCSTHCCSRQDKI